MAPRWLGPHHYAQCQYCKNRFPIAAELISGDFPTRCFCCGAACDIWPNLVRGDFVSSTPFNKSDPLGRLDVVVFREPNQAQSSVKRVWGLPGETIQLEDGELLINGQLFQKSLQQFVELAVTVSRFPDDAYSHWKFVDAHSNMPIESTFHSTLSPKRLELVAGQSIQFEHQRAAPLNHATMTMPSEIMDDYAVNQGVTFPLRAVADRILALRQCPDSRHSEWQILFWYQDHEYRLTIGGEQSAESLLRAEYRHWLPGRAEHLKIADELLIAFCDGKAFIAWSCEGKLFEREHLIPNHWVEDRSPSKSINLSENVRAHDFRADSQDSKNESRTVSSHAPLAIEVIAGRLVIEQMVVARDLWLGPRNSRATEWSPTLPLGKDGYWVLGDNLPVSQDSREVWLNGIPRTWIEGMIAIEHGDWRQLFAPSRAR